MKSQSQSQEKKLQLKINEKDELIIKLNMNVKNHLLSFKKIINMLKSELNDCKDTLNNQSQSNNQILI